MVFVNADSDLETARRVAGDLRLPGIHLWAGPSGPDGPLPSALRVASWPLFLLIDGDGVVRWRSHRFEGLREVALACVARAGQAVGGFSAAGGRPSSVPAPFCPCPDAGRRALT